MKVLNFVLSLILCFGSIEAYNQIYEGPIKVEYEQYLDVVKGLLPDNPVVLEAGGHYGQDTVRFAATWPQGTILSFEPNPGAFTKLVMNTYNLKNVNAFPIALSEHDGQAVLHVCYGTNGNDPLYEGASSLLDPADYMAVHYQGPDVSVPCRTLDNWCLDNGYDHIDFMWLDLEGMELQVLRSSPNILKTVKVILVETSFQEFRKGMTQYKPLKDFLESSGFTLLCHSYAEGWQGDAIFIKR